MAHAATKINTDVLQHYNQHGGGLGGTSFGRQTGTIAHNIRNILGDTVHISRALNNGDMAVNEGLPQSTYGIPFATDGTATVVEDIVSLWVSSKQDPIKAVFATSVHPSKRAIFKRKWVRGAQSLIVPERAPARTVSVQFDQREELLTRHAISLEQNIYLYQRPADAKQDLDMKLEAIEEQLHQSWVSITYEKAFQHGVDIVKALQRGNALMGQESDPRRRALAADRMYTSMFCGIVSKSEFPFKNLAASMAKANIYTPTGKSRVKPSVLLVPPGLVDLTRYTKQSDMYYSITGLKTDDGKNKVDIPMKDVLEYPDANGLRVLVHKPPPLFRSGGAAYPQVEENEMQTPTTFAMYYVEKEAGIADPNAGGGGNAPYPPETAVSANACVITDFEAREWHRCQLIKDNLNGRAGGANYYYWYLRPQMSTQNDSAILSLKPGSETGDMMYSYPSVQASSSQHVGQFILTLTVYFGAAVRHPENLMILNGIKFNGIIGGGGTRTLHLNPADVTQYSETDHDLLSFVTETPPWSHEIWNDDDFRDQAGPAGYNLYPATFFGGGPIPDTEESSGIPVVFYRGTTRLDNGLKPRKSNNGHLEHLDHPANVAVIEGYQQYQELVRSDF